VPPPKQLINRKQQKEHIMKCPKCGFNSFEHLKNCKRCNTDLTTFKQSLGIQAVILPTSQFRAPLPEAAVDEPALAPPAADEESFTWSSTAAAPTGESTSFLADNQPVAESAADEFDFSDAVPASGLAAHPTETFGEFSFDDQPASAPAAATAEPAETWGELSATDLPEFTTGAEVTSLDDVFKQEEAKPSQQQTPPGDDLFHAAAFADLFKDDDQAK
jgi:predicted  nucleic acid-binding Zn-ribbon protein